MDSLYDYATTDSDSDFELYYEDGTDEDNTDQEGVYEVTHDSDAMGQSEEEEQPDSD